MGNNIKFGLCVLALLGGVIYIEAGAMNLSMMDTMRQLGADLLHRLRGGGGNSDSRISGKAGA